MLEEPEERIRRQFYLYKHHLDYLESYGKNINQTLRDKLDAIMQIEKKHDKNRFVNEYFIPVSIGVVIILLSLMQTKLLIMIITMLIGIFLIIFGTIGGINEVYTTRRGKRGKT